MTGKGLREDRKERDHGGFPLLLFRFLIKAFRNDGYGGDCGNGKEDTPIQEWRTHRRVFLLSSPAPPREGVPGFPAKSPIWQGGKGRGFFLRNFTLTLALSLGG